MGVVREVLLRTAKTGTGQVLTTRWLPERGLPSLNLLQFPPSSDNRAGNPYFVLSGGFDAMAPHLRLNTC